MKTLKEFEKRGNALADQYSKIEVLDNVFINGKFTLGENIGDLGGVLGAYDGLQLFFEENGYPEPIDGFTADQRFLCHGQPFGVHSQEKMHYVHKLKRTLIPWYL